MTPALIVYAFFVIATTKEGPQSNDQVFSDRFNCQIAAAQMADQLQANPKVDGWTFVGEPCAAVPMAVKS